MEKASGSRNRLLRGLIVGAIGACMALVFSFIPGFLQGFESQTWDWRVRTLAKPGTATDEVALILLDQNSLNWGEEEQGLSWPWPREAYSFVINFCARAGVKALAFDVLYTESSTYGVYDDEALGMAISDMGRFVAAVFLGDEIGQSTEWPPLAPDPAISIDELTQGIRARRDEDFELAAFPIPELLATANMLGNVSAVPDSDGVFRRGNLYASFDGFILASLSLATFMVEHAEDRSIGIHRRYIALTQKTVPTDTDGRVIVNYRGPSGTHKSFSAAAVIQSEVNLLSGEEPLIDPQELAGKYVFFGFSAPGLLDLRPSAVAPVYTGVEIHATMLDNLLSDDFVRELSPIFYRVLLFSLVFLGGFIVTITSGGIKNTLFYILFLAVPIPAAWLSFIRGFWLPIIVPEAALLITVIGAGVANYVTEGRQKRFIKGAFSQYLSPTVIDQLIDQPDRLKLGGERRELSIFFSDLQGFTSISEGLSPEDLTSLLNDYLTAMTDIILEEGGTIDKYEGDAIIAFWNAPIEQPDHARRAVFSALRCQGKLAEMRPEFRTIVGSDLRMRIGINSGPAVVGNMGSHNRFDYTMLGDAVNLAARLEGINKQFNTYTMISQSTFNALGDAFPARELSRVGVVGRKEAVTVYEPMLPERYSKRQSVISAFEQALYMFYDGKFAQAEKVFAKISKVDPAAVAYRAKCRELIAKAPEPWDGVWIMTSK